jgi:uncharacterized RDD family membrane protein YckC
MIGKCKECGHEAGIRNLMEGYCKSCTPEGLASAKLVYAGFWRRFGAYWVDALLFLPFIGLSLWGGEQSRLFQLYWLLPGLIIGLWFHVYLVKRYGGTPGKLLLKIRITKLGGEAVGYKEAMLRYSVLFCITLLMSVALIPLTLEMTDAMYFSMGWQERSIYMAEQAPAWFNFSTIAMNVWIWSEFIVMLTNKRRRALHDFIAGTVVIYSHQPNKSSQQDASEAVAAV